MAADEGRGSSHFRFRPGQDVPADLAENVSGLKAGLRDCQRDGGKNERRTGFNRGFRSLLFQSPVFNLNVEGILNKKKVRPPDHTFLPFLFPVLFFMQYRRVLLSDPPCRSVPSKNPGLFCRNGRKQMFSGKWAAADPGWK